jgi:hypothetical protein
MQSRFVLAAGLVTSVMLTGCSKENPKFAVAPPDYGIIKPCKDDGHNGDAPTVMYQITIPAGFDFHHPVVIKETFPMVSGNPDTSHPLPNPVDPNTPDATRLDIVTQVKAPKQTALIRIVNQDTTLDFQAGKAAVWDPLPKNNGYSNMFCGLDTSVAGQVTFTLHYPDSNGPNKITQGHPNIGMIVKDRDEPAKYSLPVFLDPDVTNDG